MPNYPTFQVNLSNCDQEPIHLIGRIQPHGFLLVVDQPSLTIEQASENAAHYLKLEHAVLLNSPLHQLLSGEEYLELEKQLRTQEPVPACVLTLKGEPFFGFFHRSGGKILLEAEPHTPTTDNATLHSYGVAARLLGALDGLDTLESIAQAVATCMQSHLDYDRVLVLRYDEQWNSEVIAEKSKPGIDSYLRHHFPSSDIPAPARALLVKKPVRHIPDVSAAPVPILPYVNPTTGAPTDLLASNCATPRRCTWNT